jgi:DNA-binding GntR family transcriptional regulator
MADENLQHFDEITVESIYQAIREQILTGKLEAGQWLREVELGASFGVSRTPVREALRLLAAEGMVAHERNRGVQVQSWTLDDLNEVYSLRSLLEPWGYKLAAQNGTADLAALDELANAMDEELTKKTPSIQRVTELNIHFHSSILQCSGNERLCQLVGSFVQVPFVYRNYANFDESDFKRSFAQHHEIVEALRARDGEWAESAMRAHLHGSWKTVQQKHSWSQARTTD